MNVREKELHTNEQGSLDSDATIMQNRRGAMQRGEAKFPSLSPVSCQNLKRKESTSVYGRRGT